VRIAGLTFAALLLATTALAQTPPPRPPGPSPEASDEEIIITGQRPRGQVLGDIPPERQLDAAGVRALGASSVSDILTTLAPELRSSQGRGGERPVVLVNGRRVGSFAEVRDIPSEAIVRVDILPEEVALKYGFPATAKVINFVLRRRFAATTGEAEGLIATDGGWHGANLSVNLLQIRSNSRLLLDAKGQGRALLTESERDILADPARPDQRDARSLLPRTRNGGLNAVFDRALSENLALTVTGRLDYTEADSLTGRAPPSLVPLERHAETLTTGMGATLARTKVNWGWTVVAGYDRVDRRTLTDLSNGLARRSSSLSDTLSLDATTQGAIAELPAGDLMLTASLAQEGLWIDSDAFTPGQASSGASLSRSDSEARVAIDIPIAKASEGVHEALGTLSINANAAINELSDAGTLTTVGAGVAWTPVQPLRLIVSYSREEGAPTVQQLGNPQLITPNVPVFDFATGRSANVTSLDGGNAGLVNDVRRIFKAGLTLRPLSETDLTITATYTRSITDDPSETLSSTSALYQAAFPNRYQRDASGSLIGLDRRPVNLDQSRRSDLRWGISYTRPIAASAEYSAAMRKLFQQRGAPFQQGQNRPQGQAGPPPGGPPNAGQPGAGPPRGPNAAGGGAPGFGGRLQVSLFHTWRFSDELRLAPGLAPIDLLDGGSAGDGALGGRTRHEIEGQFGYTRHGLGLRLTATWQSATTVDSPLGGPLRFDDRASVNLRLFANLGVRPELVSRAPWLRGTRVTLAVDNLFNARQQVRDATGVTPVTLQPDFLDPQGRVIRLSLRKLFF
jgi:hypothetical protein